MIRKLILWFIQPIMYVTIQIYKSFLAPSLKHLIIRNGTTDLYTFIMIFIKKEYDFAFSFRPTLIIDAGANVGYASVFFNKKNPNASIIAIEPEVSNHEVLIKNTLKIEKIEIFQKALWHKEGIIYLQLPNEIRQKDSYFVNEDKNIGVAINTLTPQELISKHLGKNILFKIDIESAEFDLFNADDDNWINQVKGFIIETHDRFKQGCENMVLDKLNKYGFQITHRPGNLIFAQKL